MGDEDPGTGDSDAAIAAECELSCVPRADDYDPEICGYDWPAKDVCIAKCSEKFEHVRDVGCLDQALAADHCLATAVDDVWCGTDGALCVAELDACTACCGQAYCCWDEYPNSPS